jgi:branched-chain amino acid transport system ATP-binding protein
VNLSLFEVNGVGKSFGGVRANDDIGFNLESGELLALIGPNGAGKSTLFNMINGQLCADQGSIKLNGRELVGLRPRDIWRLGVGRTFQIASPFSSMTARQNVQMALMSRDSKLFSFFTRATDHCQEEAMELLRQVGLQMQADRPCSVLAYGDVKCLELAVAMAHSPRLLLMDEPTAGMSPRERNDMMALTRELVVNRGMAVLFTEHSMDVVFAYADRIIVLARGRLIAQGQPAEIRDNPKVKEVYFGGGTTFGANQAKRGEGESLNGTTNLIRGDKMLEVRALSSWYGAAQILFDVDLEVRRGEVVALMGRNGAGKSTMLMALMGLISRRRGRVEFMGVDVSNAKSYQVSAMGIGFVPEDRRIFTDLTVLENLDVGRQPARAWSDGEVLPAWTPELLFKLFPNLGEMPNRGANRMSGGEQQMLTVARTLMGNPYLLLLDEPSEGVAPLIIEQMVDMILVLKARGVSILLSEQNMHFAQLVSDRAYVLEKGQIRYEGRMTELMADEAVRSAYLSI